MCHQSVLRFSALALLLLLDSTKAQAQLASLVLDLHPSTEVDRFSPSSLFGVNGRALFRAEIGDLGGELWLTDGTSQGTELLADTCPGCFGFSTFLVGQGSRLAYLGAANPAAGGRAQLWRTDGTRLGTFPVTPGDGSVGLSSATSELLPTLGDRLLFRASTALHGSEPWVSDGTAEGTQLLIDLLPGEFSSDPRMFTRVGQQVFFIASDASFDRLLWRTDGTPAGTRPILPVQPEADFGVAAGGRLFFFASDGQRRQLWSSDGSAAGTRPITAFDSNSILFSSWLKTVGNHVYFLASAPSHGTELWRSDGTAAGTRRVTNFVESHPFLNGDGLGAGQVTEAGGKIFVVATDGSLEVGLYTSTGEPASTRRIATLNQCFEHFCPDDLPGSLLVPVGGRVLTLASNGPFSGNNTLRSFDGTAGGEVVLHSRPQADFIPTWGLLAGRPGEAFFLALDAAGRSVVYRTDGRPEGTRPVVAFPRSINVFDLSILEHWLLPVGTNFVAVADEELWATSNSETEARRIESSWRIDNFFSAPQPDLTDLLGRLVWHPGGDFGGPRGVWESNGTAETTQPFAVLEASCPEAGTELLASNDHELFYSCERFDGQPGSGTWRTDGTPPGTVLVFPRPDASGNSVETHYAAGETLTYFTARHDDFILWRTDGTAAGTFGLIPDLPGRDSYSVASLHVVGDQLYFLGAIADNRLQLWTSDGTAAGTVSLTELAEGFSTFQTTSWAELDGSVVFAAGNAFNDVTELWRTDGTTQGTGRLLDCALTGLSCNVTDVYGVDGGLLFFAGNRFGGTTELWGSDGTQAGTLRLQRFHSARTGVAVVGDRLCFGAAEENENPDDLELWASDGTLGGTGRLEDILPGPQGSRPRELTAAGNRLFFTARSVGQGEEFWSTDGSTAGTRLVHDISPGPRSSNPVGLTVVGDRLYFIADDGTHGQELWSLDLTEEPGVCQPGPRSLCLQDNRFRVDIAWRDFQSNSGRGNAVPLTADTGYFWFFNENNVETIVKVLDGRPINEHFWTFYGALSNVEYTMTVTDAQTGLTQRYFNPSRQFASVGDTESFGPNGASLESFTAPNELLYQSHEPEIASLFDALFERSTAGSCAPSSTRLCLNNSRFAVEATWTDFQGNSGVGMAEPLTGDTAYFWFFRDSNVEVLVKVLDGRPVNGKFWVFYGALSNVEYTLTVTDTETGAVRTYRNPLRNFGSVGDTGAF